jgi:pseudouridine synthase
MGLKIEPGLDVVTVEGQEIKSLEGKIYVLLNKPVEVVTTLNDPQNRKKVIDLLLGVKERVYPVGRLDFFTEGLLLFTNDGELAFRLTHPKYEVDKTYEAKIRGTLTTESIELLKKGVMLDDGITSPAKLHIISMNNGNTTLQITIHEGRNRQVRRMLEAIGHVILTLKRVQYGPLNLGDLAIGQYRYLSELEVKALKRACQLS